MVEVREVSITSSGAARLIQERSEKLKRITGSSGRSSFKLISMENRRATFLIAYLDGEPVGCGKFLFE